MGEIIHIHIGQCGVQVGSALWERLALEHGIASDGSLTGSSEGNKLNKLFSETKEGNYTARSLFIDADQFVIDSVKKGSSRQLFSSSNLLCHKEESGGVHSRAHYTSNRDFRDLCMDRIRQLSEGCESPQGYIVTHSICGGFGSGFGTWLLTRMNGYGDDRKKLKVTYSMFPSSRVSNLVVEPYNVVLGNGTLLENTDLSIAFDNEALYNVCSSQLDNESPSYADINQLVSQALSTSSSSLRFNSSLNSNLCEMVTNLVPYPRIHYALPSYAPFGKGPCTVEDITKAAFHKDSTMLSCNLKQDKYIACSVIYRGDVSPENAVNVVNKLKALREIRMINWCPTGVKTGITYQNPPSISNDSRKSREVGVVVNSGVFSKVFEREGDKFDKLYAKRAFVHWFVGEGMESGEFAEVRENLYCIKKDYDEIQIEQQPDDEDDDDY